MNRQRIMLIAMGVLFVSIGAILYVGFFREGPLPGFAPGTTALAPLPQLPLQLEKIVSEADLAILQDPRFTKLVKPAGIPLVVPPGGRANPFAPL